MKKTKRKDYSKPMFWILANLIVLYIFSCIDTHTLNPLKVDTGFNRGILVFAIVHTILILYWWKIEFSKKKYNSKI